MYVNVESSLRASRRGQTCKHSSALKNCPIATDALLQSKGRNLLLTLCGRPPVPARSENTLSMMAKIVKTFHIFGYTRM